jgi:DNA adenine methylase
VIKWAGGKSKIINQFSKYIPEKFNNYHEPFVGGGALFFYLIPDLIKRNATAYLSDLIEEVINLYQIIKNDVDNLIKTSKKHKYEEDYYYNIRSLETSKMSDIERASRILYLNKTCFNGLYRVNNKGKFNVSFGDYINPVIVDEVTLRNASKAFQYAEIFHSDFEMVLKNARKGDFVYLDPPYVPLSATSDFTKYTSGSFGGSDHERLKSVFDELKSRGCYVMLSNSNTEFVNNLYSGCNIKTVNASRAINSNTAKRGAIKELVILSYMDNEIGLSAQVQ